MVRVSNVYISFFILFVKNCFGYFNDCQNYSGITETDKLYIQNADNEDLEYFGNCLQYEQLVLRISVQHSNITLASLVSALPDTVRKTSTVLVINDCDMRRVPGGVLTNMSSLVHIDFGNNTIEELEENSFQDMGEVTEINLSYNFLTKISGSTFHNLRKLRELSIVGNKLFHISPTAFMNLPVLDVLYMDNNDLQDIPYSSFRNSPIKYWHLKNNRIAEISSQIEHFLHLVHLDIRDNSLKTISKELLTLRHLRDVHVDGNNLSTIPKEISVLFETKTNCLTLGNNPWACDCDLVWLVTMVKEGLVNEKLLCSTPQNISMVQFDTTGLECKPETLRKGIKWYIVVAMVLSSLLVVVGFVAAVLLYFLKKRTRRKLMKPIEMVMNGQYYRPRSVADSSSMTVYTNTLQFTSTEITDKNKKFTGYARLMNTTKVYGRLRLGKLIGRGAFGDVFEGSASDSNNIWRKVAVKKIRENAPADDSEALMKEYQNLADIGNHPNIIQVIGTGEINGSLILVLEFADNGDLLAHLKGLERADHKVIQNLDSSEYKVYLQNTHPRLFLYMWHIAKGMEYLSRLKIIHRDLAGRNILLSTQHVAKISDFGLSRDVCENGVYHQHSNGRMPYKWMSPESLSSGKYTTKNDVWSFGILLWEIVTLGASPYPGIPPDMLQNMYKHNYVMPQPHLCPDYIYCIMEKCWSFMSEKRPEFDSLLETLDQLLQTVANKEYMDVCRTEEELLKD